MDTTKLEFRGLRSSVVVDGSDVPHYGVQYDEGTMTATSWIVSETDTPFAVHVELMNRIPGADYSVQVFLDGHRVGGSIFRPQDSHILRVESTRVSHTETRKFMFGALELSDDDALLDASDLKALGEIKISFNRIGSLIPAPAKYAAPPQAQKVHERAKKGLAHGVTYGGVQLDPLPKTPTFFHCSNLTLVASHVIKYRPLAMLQANGIVPYASANNRQNASKTPPPVPASLSAGKSKKRKTPKEADVKPVIDVSNDGDEDAVKKENRTKRSRTQQRPAKKVKQEERKPIISGEVIDLTI